MVRAKKDEAAGSTSNKTQKDPNKPKKALSAYFIWLMANRPSIAKQGMSVTDVSKKAGALWRGMSEDEKKPWEKKAAADKERYAEAMAVYNGGKK